MKVTDFNRHTIPPGGWVFREPSTGWSAPTPIASTFEQTVQQIIAMRKKNPAITAKFQLATAPEVVASELEKYTRKRLGLPEAAQVPFPASRSLRLGSVADAVAAVKKMASGAASLLDWEQSGEPPVRKEVSENRATICASCPENEKGTTITEWFTLPASNVIKRHFERLHELNLRTTHDDELSVCKACECPLKLKVHEPLHLILKHIRPDAKAKLDPRCWIIA